MLVFCAVSVFLSLFFRSFWLLLINCYFYDIMGNVNAAETSLLSMCSHHVFHGLQWNSYQFEILWHFEYEIANQCHYSLWIWMIDIFAGYNENAKRNVCFGCHYHCTCSCTWKPFEYLFHEVVKSGSVGAFI